MASNSSPGDKLIALEGFDGREVETVARSLKKHFCRKFGGGVSSWDASSIFYELERSGFRTHPPSPRILLLLYAADLSFRLLWQIRPALKEGQCVIAAPYIETAMAFGRAAGLPVPWLNALFRFAPPAGTAYRIQEPRGTVKKKKPADGFVEFNFFALKEGSSPLDLKEMRQKFIAYLAEQERHGLCRTVPRRLLAASSA